jgi:hypothetical protein
MLKSLYIRYWPCYFQPRFENIASNFKQLCPRKMTASPESVTYFWECHECRSINETSERYWQHGQQIHCNAQNCEKSQEMTQNPQKHFRCPDCKNTDARGNITTYCDGSKVIPVNWECHICQCTSNTINIPSEHSVDCALGPHGSVLEAPDPPMGRPI